MGMWNISVLGTRVVTKSFTCLGESIAGGNTAEYWVLNEQKFTETTFLKWIGK